MINLLPNSHKQFLMRDYRMRLNTLYLIGATFLLFISLILLGTLRSSLADRLDTITENIEVLENNGNGVDVYSDIVKDTRGKLLVLVREEGTLKVTSVLNQILSNINSDISLNSILVELDGEKKAVLNGTALDRTTLLKFRSDLLNEENIISVESPISDLKETKDITFSISIMVSEL